MRLFRKNLNKSIETCQATINDDNCTTAQQSEDKIWLKNNSEPWDTVVEKWINTYNLRCSNTSSSLINELIIDWPILKKSNGFLLV